MGIGGISVWQLLIILLIVVLLFGTKKLRNIGTDLGGAIKSFKKSISDKEDDKKQLESSADDDESDPMGGKKVEPEKDKA